MLQETDPIALESAEQKLQEAFFKTFSALNYHRNFGNFGTVQGYLIWVSISGAREGGETRRGERGACR